MSEVDNDAELKEVLAESMESGQRAEIALKEIDGAMKALHLDCYEAFNRSEVHDSDGHKTCRMYLQVLKDVEGRLKKAIRNGETARKRLMKIRQTTPILRKIANG